MYVNRLLYSSYKIINFENDDTIFIPKDKIYDLLSFVIANNFIDYTVYGRYSTLLTWNGFKIETSDAFESEIVMSILLSQIAEKSPNKA